MRTDWMNDGKRKEWKNFYRRLFYKFIIRKYLLDCSSFLDVACGRGLFLDCVQGGNKIGIDIDPPKDHYVFDCQKMRYEDWTEQMDCVFASQFIEHVDGTTFVKWATNIAQKKIVIITGRPSTSFWDDPTHIRPFTKKAIRCLLEENNWKILLNTNLYPTQAHITIARRHD